VVEGVQALKQQDGPELQVHGSGDLLQTLWGAGLVDEVRLLTFPVVLGSGKRLFEGGGLPTAFDVVSSRLSSTGVVMSVYRAAGRPQTGSFGG
jgi:dihydrofolate reductase